MVDWSKNEVFGRVTMKRKKKWLDRQTIIQKVKEEVEKKGNIDTREVI